MKVLIFSAIVSMALAKPSGVAVAPVAYAVPAAFPVSSQYHAQDELGQYTYGYASPLSSKAEARSINGITSGGYSYVDAEGKLQSVQYTSDAVNGFRVAASNLPVAPAIPVAPALVAPAPVPDTPEVAAAKAKHAEALKEAEAKAAEVPEEKAAEPAPAATVYTAPAAVVAPPHPVPVAVPYSVGFPTVPVSYAAFGASPVTTYSFATPVLPALTTYTTQVAALPVPEITAKVVETKEKPAEEKPKAEE